MAHIIKVDGSKEAIADTELKTLQEAVGGYIEIVPISMSRYIVLDEEGKLKGKQVNKLATMMYENPNDCIVGDVVVCNQDEID